MSQLYSQLSTVFTSFTRQRPSSERQPRPRYALDMCTNRTYTDPMSRQQRLKDTIREAQDLIDQGIAIERNQARLDRATASLENLREYMREYQRKRRPEPQFKASPEARQARRHMDAIRRPLKAIRQRQLETAPEFASLPPLPPTDDPFWKE